MRLFSRDALVRRRKASWSPATARNSTPCASSSTGMDRRTIDWKQSARHGKLLAKEFRTERNHPVILAHRYRPADVRAAAAACRASTGRSNAALLLAFVGLKTGDRVGLFGFDAQAAPVRRGAVSGAQRLPAAAAAGRRASTTRPRRPTSPWA